MKIIIQDNQGKQMIFETLYEVEELGKNCKTFICEEWILLSGEKYNEWFGIKENETYEGGDK
jgi:hypothetical protein